MLSILNLLLFIFGVILGYGYYYFNFEDEEKVVSNDLFSVCYLVEFGFE